MYIPLLPFNVQAMWNDTAPLGRAVLVTMLLMSVYSSWVVLDRWLRYRDAVKAARVLMPELARRLNAGDAEGAARLARSHLRSPHARVVHAILDESGWRGHGPQTGLALDSAQRALEQAIEDTAHELREGLGGLATVAASAPFVGLLGTVVGIIRAFGVIGELGSSNFGQLAGAIGEALFTTAAGLIVAIPAVWFYNHFNLKVESFAVDMRRTGVKLLDFVALHARA